MMSERKQRTIHSCSKKTLAQKNRAVRYKILKFSPSFALPFLDKHISFLTPTLLSTTKSAIYAIPLFSGKSPRLKKRSYFPNDKSLIIITNDNGLLSPQTSCPSLPDDSSPPSSCVTRMRKPCIFSLTITAQALC